MVWSGYGEKEGQRPAMIAFEVYVNKVKVCTAGLDELDYIFSNLACSLNKDRRPDDPTIIFSVSGVAGKEMFSWAHYSLAIGHRVEIRIVDSSKADKPKRIRCSGGSCAILQISGGRHGLVVDF